VGNMQLAIILFPAAAIFANCQLPTFSFYPIQVDI
jgi:hypothetical protein